MAYDDVAGADDTRQFDAGQSQGSRDGLSSGCAAAAPARCLFHGEVDDDHFPCRRPGESAMEFTARCFGEVRDV